MIFIRPCYQIEMRSFEFKCFVRVMGTADMNTMHIQTYSKLHETQVYTHTHRRGRLLNIHTYIYVRT